MSRSVGGPVATLGLAWAALVGACAGAGAGSRPADDGGSGGAPLEGTSTGAPVLAPCEVARVPLALDDGTQLYVEPEALIPLGSDFLVAGTATYTWEVSANAPVARRTADEHVAARFDLSGRSRLYEKPIPGAIGSVRVVALGGDRWGMLFDEVHPDSLPAKHHLLEVWYAEHDGGRWVLLERLPRPERGVLDFWSDSELVRTDRGLAWVAPTRLPLGLAELLYYERRDGAWRYEVVSDEWVEIATLAYDSDGRTLWMARFSEDPGIPGWQQSLRLYRLGAGWDLVSRITVMESGSKVFAPRALVLPDGVAVSWRVQAPGRREARAAVGIGDGRAGTEVTLDPSVFEVVPLGMMDGAPAWIVNHIGESSFELRVVRAESSSSAPPSVVVVAAVANPYPSFFAAHALASGEVIVVGPEVGRDPGQPTVRSLVLRLSTSCN